MIVVIDTSAAIDLILAGDAAPALEKHVTAADWLIAPDLFVPEVANVLWKYVQQKFLVEEEASTALERTVALIDDFYPATELYREAFSLACNSKSPAYDMFFLALARRHAAKILTRDRELARLARKAGIPLAE